MSLLPIKLAKSVLGKVGSFKKVLSAVPNLSGLAFPPQVQIGLKVAGMIGLKVPSEDKIRQIVSGKISGILEPISKILGKGEEYAKKIESLDNNRTVEVFEKILSGGRITKTDAEDLLNAIDWLL